MENWDVYVQGVLYEVMCMSVDGDGAKQGEESEVSSQAALRVQAQGFALGSSAPVVFEYDVTAEVIRQQEVGWL